jgi:hypothetical protein
MPPFACIRPRPEPIDAELGRPILGLYGEYVNSPFMAREGDKDGASHQLTPAHVPLPDTSLPEEEVCVL